MDFDCGSWVVEGSEDGAWSLNEGNGRRLAEGLESAVLVVEFGVVVSSGGVIESAGLVGSGGTVKPAGSEVLSE